MCQYGYKTSQQRQQHGENNTPDSNAFDTRISYKFDERMIQSQERFHVNGQATGTLVGLRVDQQPRESVVRFEDMSTRTVTFLAVTRSMAYLRTT